jgi:3D (Asp-Asp-Asp) domain-containing protein
VATGWFSPCSAANFREEAWDAKVVGAAGVPLTAINEGQPSSIAVDPRVIPLRSHVWIESIGRWFRALDTGGGILGQHIDVYVGLTPPVYGGSSNVYVLPEGSTLGGTDLSPPPGSSGPATPTPTAPPVGGPSPGTPCSDPGDESGGVVCAKRREWPEHHYRSFLPSPLRHPCGPGCRLRGGLADCAGDDAGAPGELIQGQDGQRCWACTNDGWTEMYAWACLAPPN